MQKIKELSKFSNSHLKGKVIKFFWTFVGMILFIVFINYQFKNLYSKVFNVEYVRLEKNFASIIVIHIFNFILMSGLTISLFNMCLEISKNKNFTLRQVLFGFWNWWMSTRIVFGVRIRLIFWYILFIIPGIIKSFSYVMAYYIIIENPKLKAKEAIKRSVKIMDGHKFYVFKYFLHTTTYFLFPFVLFLISLNIVILLFLSSDNSDSNIYGIVACIIISLFTILRTIYRMYYAFVVYKVGVANIYKSLKVKNEIKKLREI